jgi:hypothetical protein
MRPTAPEAGDFREAARPLELNGSAEGVPNGEPNQRTTPAINEWLDPGHLAVSRRDYWHNLGPRLGDPDTYRFAIMR